MKDDIKNALLLKDDAKPIYIATVYGGIGALAFWLLTK